MVKDLNPEDSIEKIPLIGSVKCKQFSKLNITTVKDLLFHIPFRYKDTSAILSIPELNKEMQGTILATVEDIKNIYTRSRKVITKAVIANESGNINVVWFNQPYQTKSIQKGKQYLFEGKLSEKTKELISPSYEPFYESLDKQKHLGKITTFYAETKGITSKWLRSRIDYALEKVSIEDPLPITILEKEKLETLFDAIKNIHQPNSYEEIIHSRKRLAFDEMLRVAIQIEERIIRAKKRKAYIINHTEEQLKTFYSILPYNLTNDQINSINEILTDMSKPNPMQRLLNGDVGSGKTVIAAACAYAAYINGYTTLIMAPTSVLANQHYITLSNLLKPLNIRIDLRVGGAKLKNTNNPRIVIGTHALLYEKSLPNNVALTIVDEQHRFGVQQREQISLNNSAISPHYMSMTATPIPRTLTNVLFGDTKVSFLRDMPAHRIPIKSHFVPNKKRKQCYEWIKKRLTQFPEEQAFIVFPLVEESIKIESKAAKIEFNNLSNTVLKGLKVGLLHGQMKEKEKNKIIKDFKNKRYSVLISTPIVEVGIDISDATVMVIENSERFGLAQLHQFRGRVGRGKKQSYCFVLAGEQAEDHDTTIERLKYFTKHSSGFDVAEYDLQKRGPGEVYGNKQSGIPNFKVASITDLKLLISCRKIAEEMFKKEYDINRIKGYLFR